MTNPIDIRCNTCSAQPGEPCTSKRVEFHNARIERAANLDGHRTRSKPITRRR